MAANNRDGASNKPAGQNQREEDPESNPQDGSQWDNYQTRSLSSEEGEGKITESDLLSADEVPAQKGNNSSGL